LTIDILVLRSDVRHTIGCVLDKQW